MLTFSISSIIDASKDRVWAILRDFQHVDRWVIDLASCRPECTGAVTLRHLVQKDGARVVEQLDRLDDSSNTIQYHIVESDLPFSLYKSDIQVVSEGFGGCRVIWTSTIEPIARGSSERLVETLKINYRRYLERLSEISKQ